MYYRYDEHYILIEKSSSELLGDNVVTCWEDLDIELYKVTVMYINDNNEMLRYTKSVRDNEVLARRILALEEQLKNKQ